MIKMALDTCNKCASVGCKNTTEECNFWCKECRSEIAKYLFNDPISRAMGKIFGW